MWQPVMSGIQQSLIWFTIFINSLDDGTDCTFSKIVDDTKREVTEGNWRITWLGCLLKGSQKVREMAWNKPPEVQQRQMQGLTPGMEYNPIHQQKLGTNCLGGNLTEKNLGILMDRLNKRQQCILAATSCYHAEDHTSTRSGEKISLLYSAILSSHPEYHVRLRSSIWDISTYVRVPWSGTKTVRWLEHTTREERLR